MAQEKYFELDHAFLATAGFEPSEIDRFGTGLTHNANLYLMIFQRMHEKNLGDDFWYRFRAYAGTMTNWAKDIADKKLPHNPGDFRIALEIGSVDGFEELDDVLGTTEEKLYKDSLLFQWSYFAANISQAGLQGKYVKFLDMCAETSVGFPTYRWNTPYGQVKHPTLPL